MMQEPNRTDENYVTMSTQEFSPVTGILVAIGVIAAGLLIYLSPMVFQ